MKGEGKESSSVLCKSAAHLWDIDMQVPVGAKCLNTFRSEVVEVTVSGNSMD
jgi:hypothetical protein